LGISSTPAATSSLNWKPLFSRLGSKHFRYLALYECVNLLRVLVDVTIFELLNHLNVKQKTEEKPKKKDNIKIINQENKWK